MPITQWRPNVAKKVVLTHASLNIWTMSIANALLIKTAMILMKYLIAINLWVHVIFLVLLLIHLNAPLNLNAQKILLILIVAHLELPGLAKINLTVTKGVNAHQIMIAGMIVELLIVLMVSVRQQALLLLLLAIVEVIVHGINVAKQVQILAHLISCLAIILALNLLIQ